MSDTTQLNDPADYLAVDDLELVAKGLVEGAVQGSHRSLLMGSSVEFDSHRGYQFGDDLRHINWNLWARTNELCIKQYQAETNLALYIALDFSGSMKTANAESSKVLYGSRLAAALAHLSLKGRDAVSLALFKNEIIDFLPPKINQAHFENILLSLMRFEADGNAEMSLPLSEWASQTRAKGLVVLISDLYDNEDEMFKTLSALKYSGHEVIIFHLLDSFEWELPQRGRFKFIDLETGEKLKVGVSKIRENYKMLVENWVAGLEKRCENLGIDYTLCLTNEALIPRIVDYMHKRQELHP